MHPTVDQIFTESAKCIHFSSSWTLLHCPVACMLLVYCRKLLQVWSLPDGHCKLTLHGHQAAVTCVQFDDTRIISGALDRLIKIWSLESGQVTTYMLYLNAHAHNYMVRYVYLLCYVCSALIICLPLNCIIYYMSLLSLVCENNRLDSIRRTYWSD